MPDSPESARLERDSDPVLPVDDHLRLKVEHVLPDADHVVEAAAIDVVRPRPENWRKRAIDIVVAGFLALLTLPVLLLGMLLVVMSTKGVVIFCQERIGLGYKPFTIYKLRTMRAGADAELADLLEQHGREATPLFKVPNDPRITRVGRILRKLSIDELPQLWNVIRGDMSLVGPRPQRQAEVAMYTDYERQRLLVKPGLTGPWQVHGRSNLPWAKAVEFDVDYALNHSFSRDLVILWRTVWVVLSQRGAS